MRRLVPPLPTRPLAMAVSPDTSPSIHLNRHFRFRSVPLHTSSRPVGHILRFDADKQCNLLPKRLFTSQTTSVFAQKRG